MKTTLRALYRFCCNLVDSPAVILLYHRVTNLSMDPQQLAVSPENFDGQLGFLKKKYALLSIEEFAFHVDQRKKLPKQSVVISFDDGYADNLHEAIPILEKHGAQAVFYISTSNLDTSYEFWWDNLERVFLLDQPLPETLELQITTGNYTFKTSSHQDRINTYNSLHPLIKDCPVQERERLMDFIIAWAGLSKNGRESHRIMTSQETLSLSKSNAAVIGAHTHNHPKLSVCTANDQREEIIKSKKILQELTGKPVNHFSYPFGSKADYTAETVEICRQAGFNMVSANYHNQVHRWHSQFELPRMLVRNWSLKEFETKMYTFFTF